MKRSEKITALLAELDEGVPGAADRLMPLIHAELRKIAAARFAQEQPGHTLQPTELIQETYLRLIQPGKGPWKDRTHFYGVAARSMRQILVDRARKRRSRKRGGRLTRVDLDGDFIFAPEESRLLVDLHEALTRLESLSPRQGRIVELRFFAGLTVRETAKVLKTGITTVKADWAVAKAWLELELKKTS